MAQLRVTTDSYRSTCDISVKANDCKHGVLNAGPDLKLELKDNRLCLYGEFQTCITRFIQLMIQRVKPFYLNNIISTIYLILNLSDASIIVYCSFPD